MIIDVIIPALNEEQALPLVLADLRGSGAVVRRVVVVDNGSTDRTAVVAGEGGAQVVREPRRGYGAACLAGLRALVGDPPEVVVFVDGDRSDDAAELAALLQPLREDAGVALVIGARRPCEAGALQPAQRAGNAVAVAMIRLLYGQRCSDLGPFRAVRWEALRELEMRDVDYGWTVEMQVKAARRGLRVVEVPVRYRRRAAGESKISATVRGTVGAGVKILYRIVQHAVSPR